MIFPAGMIKIDLLILKRDIDEVLEYLGKARCFQVTDRITGESSEKHREYEDALKKLRAISEFLGLPAADDPDGELGVRVPRDSDLSEAGLILSRAGLLVEEEKALEGKKLQIQNTLEEVGIFRRLGLPLKELEAVTYLTYRIGALQVAKINELRESLQNRALILDLDGNGRVFAVASKKGRFALDSELKKFDFRDTPIPQNLTDIPPEVLAGLEKELADVQKDLAVLEQKKIEYRGIFGQKIAELTRSLSVGCVVEELKDGLLSTDSVYKLSGWLPSAGSKKVLQDLETVTGDRIAIRSYAAEEVESVIEGKEKVPVKLQHGKFLRSFTDIVFSYGAPLYGTIDPTFLVSVFFILLFAVMFGDVGQGLVGVLIGVTLEKEKIPSLRKWKKYAPIFKTVGSACMFTGFLYGSFFASEEALVPLTRFLTGTLLGRSMDRFISLMPTGGIEKIAAFFGFTLGVGFLINSIGLIVNMYNRFKLKDYKNAIFSKTGITGSFLFWYSLSLGLRAGLGHKIGAIDLIILSIPVALLFWGEPLYHLLSGSRPLFPEGIFPFVMEGMVEVMESVSYFISNSVSFLRVGAFALSHAVLSLIVFQMAELISTIPGGIFFKAAVIVAGNLLIIVLEGLIVSIQVIRLQYYEFFSKFFTETGTAFKPFGFSAPRR